MTTVHDYYVLDASFDSDDCFFCFCPAEVEFEPEFKITEVVTGLSFLSTQPPEGSRFVGVIHQDGQDACEAWCEAHQEALDDLKARFGYPPKVEAT